MQEFFMNYGSYISLGLLLISDVIMWFRSRKTKRDSQTQELIDSVKLLMSVIKGEDIKNG